jgi:CRP/FNR family transcriptional regulator
MNDLTEVLSQFDDEARTDIANHSEFRIIPKGTVILREGQFVKVIPIVTAGTIKVFTGNDEKELLLYHIKPGESCIMSFAAGLKNEPSRVFAVAADDTRALLLPVSRIPVWLKKYPEFNTLFYQQYNLRYNDLIDTLNHVFFQKLDRRLFDYLHRQWNLAGETPVKLSHRQIATELGTAREVVSRLIKKLENEGKIKQDTDGILIIKNDRL